MAYLLTLYTTDGHRLDNVIAAYATEEAARQAAQGMADARRDEEDRAPLRWAADPHEPGQIAEFGNGIFRVSPVQFYNN